MLEIKEKDFLLIMGLPEKVVEPRTLIGGLPIVGKTWRFFRLFLFLHHELFFILFFLNKNKKKQRKEKS